MSEPGGASDQPSTRPGSQVPRARTLSRLPPSAPSEEPPSTRFDGEDFLFHLYRGSELLKDNCVEEAKEELERALRMQPLDVEGQALLGAVYFRLGLYPRAIEIYREITRACPEEVTPKMNLALCYLKTGQAGAARDLLEQVLSKLPEHRRAWGYLGLSFERLGEYARAQEAFDRAGQPHLARRMEQLLEGLSEVHSGATAMHDELRQAAHNAFEELDGSDEASGFERATETEAAPTRAGRWQAHEPAQQAIPPIARSGRPSFPGPVAQALAAVPESPAIFTIPTQHAPEPRGEPPVSPEALVAARTIAVGARGAERFASGLVSLRVNERIGVRAERIRAANPDGQTFRALPLKRRHRGREVDEAFAGVGSSWTLLEGSGLLVVEPSAERDLFLVRLSGEFVYVREARLVAFEGTLRYENGRLPAADPGPVAMVQLSGHGLLVFEARSSLAALNVAAEQPLSVRASNVLGWTGRLLGQAVTAEQALWGSGFVLFNGDGAVLVDDP